MQAKTIGSIATLVLVSALLLAGCGGGQATTPQPPSTTATPPPTTSSTLPTTTPTTMAPATTSAPPSSTAPTSTTPTAPPTSSAGATLPEVGIAITTHNEAAMKAYTGLCQMCHAKGLANSNPYPPTWDGKASGSTAFPGVYTIVPGSVQDHTNYTVEQCTQANCHKAPGASAPPSSTTPPASTSTPPTSSNPPSSTPAGSVITGKTKVFVTLGGFNPAKLTIAVGTTITWDNPDHEDHEVLSDTEGFDDFTVPGGSTVDSVFTQAGTYQIHLEESPTMTCIITVVN